MTKNIPNTGRKTCVKRFGRNKLRLANSRLDCSNVSRYFFNLLTTYYLAGKIPLEQCYPYGNNFNIFKQYSVTYHLGSPVVDINLTEKAVINDAGEKFFILHA